MFVPSHTHSPFLSLSLAFIFSDLHFADSLSSGIFFSFTGSSFFSLTLIEEVYVGPYAGLNVNPSYY
ncbi:hypothetical protein Bca4012_048584 [Brassica carinata]